MIFGFFKKETPEEKAEKERQELSIQSLERGGLPLRAQERIERFKKDGNLFTTDFSCNEMLLVEEAGYEPISQVMGSSFVNISYFGSFTSNRCTGELTDRTNALLLARQRAVSRLKQEAQALGAHGVIGIKLKVKNWSWASRLIECTAIGTAIKIPGRPDGGEPFTSDLSGQDFWKLYEGGHWPLTLVMGISCYYVYTDMNTRMQLRNFWGGNNLANQELHLYTQSFNHAYNLAMSRLTYQADEVAAEGVVGAQVSHHLMDVEYEINDTTYHDLLITVTSIGTAIRLDDVQREKRIQQPLMIMNVGKGSRRKAALAVEEYTTSLSDDD
ncbi:MAG TPA: heavy metal-binding domain-containing protein [Candidatus Obscuribacterales bacterium]